MCGRTKNEPNWKKNWRVWLSMSEMVPPWPNDGFCDLVGVVDVPLSKKTQLLMHYVGGNKVSVVRSLTQFTIVFYEFQFKVGVTLFFLPTDLMVRKLKSWTTRHLTWNIIGNMDILCIAWNMFKKIARNLNALKFYYHAFNPFKKIDHNFL